MLLPIGLILLQPDMGTALVYIPIFAFMAFVAGAKLRHILFLITAGVLTIVLAVLPLYEKWILGSEASLLSMITNFQVAKFFLAALLLIALLSAWGFWGFKRKYFYWILYFSSLLLVINVGALLVVRALREYQIMRFIVFLNPRIDPQGAGWNLIQSVTAVGSGGFAGKGFLQGTQSHYQFLPQQSTDFIFSKMSQ